MTALTRRISRALQPLFTRDPLASFEREMEDLVNRFQPEWREGLSVGVATPAIDLAETDDALEVRVDVPGMKPEEIDIEITGNMLRISGEHKQQKEEKDKMYHLVERRCSAFARSVSLPSAVKEDQATADYADGVLTISLPKTEAAKTRKIAVKGNGNGA